jgi:hypothetical protein
MLMKIMHTKLLLFKPFKKEYMTTINIKLELKDQFLRDVLATAVWYGSSYWAGYENPVLHKWEGQGIADYQSITVNDLGDDEESKAKYEITLAKVAEGIERLIGRNFNSEESHAQCHVSYSAAMLRAVALGDAGNVDAELADIVLQLACFGHIVYG